MNARRLGWALWTLAVLFGLTTLFFQTANDAARLPTHLFGALVNMSFATVGALIASRRPENRVGWLLLVGALVIMLGDAMLEYGVYAVLTHPHSLPAGEWMAWYGFGLRGLAFALVATLLPLLFPNGRLPSPHWRWAMWLVACSLLVLAISSVFGASSGDFRLPLLRNPLGVALPPDVSDLLLPISSLVLLAAITACGAAALVRFRRAKGDERQQLKWFAYAAVLAVGVLSALVIALIALPQVEQNFALGAFLFNLMLAGFPVAVGIAIFKYRLYDIDLIIRRTLIYSVLTAMLLVVYFASVVVLQGMGRALTGQSESELITVISTLLIAALFVPLRRRVQGAIDHRFYRRKYDAAKALEAFSVAVRDEVDLVELREHLLGVVNETMQPAHVSLWLKRESGRRD